MKANWSWSVDVVNGREGLITTYSYSRIAICILNYKPTWMVIYFLHSFVFSSIIALTINECFGLVCLLLVIVNVTLDVVLPKSGSCKCVILRLLLMLRWTNYSTRTFAIIYRINNTIKKRSWHLCKNWGVYL